MAGRKSMTEAASSWQAAARRMRDRPYDLTRRLVVPLPLTAVGESRHRIPRRIRKAGWRPFQHKLPLFRLVVNMLVFPDLVIRHR